MNPTNRMWATSLFIFYGLIPFVSGEQLDILAFDYYRKFGHDVHLGDCPDVSRYVEETKNVQTFSCHLKMGGQANFQRSEIQHEAVVTVNSPHDVFSNLGLCDGYSVSRLGLLYHSECITVDITKSIPVDEKAYNLAFFGTYRRGINVLGDAPGTGATTPSPGDTTQFYTKYITYGSKEMVLVSLKYKYEADASSAKRIEFTSEKLSERLERLLRDSNNINDITIFRMSTADRKYSKWYFPRALASGAATRVTTEQREIEEVKMRVLSDLAMDPYYTNYIMWPFSGSPQGGAMRNDAMWKNVTLCEINLYHVAQFGQAAFEQKCVGTWASGKYCKRLRRRLVRVQRIIDRDIHGRRAKWFQLSAEDKETAVTKCSRVCRNNESKMDRAVNRVMFQSVPEPSVGASRSLQSQYLQKWSKRQHKKMNSRRQTKKKGKNGKKRRKKNRRNKKRKNKGQS